VLQLIGSDDFLVGREVGLGGWWVNPSIYDATRYKPMFNPRREENCFSVTPERKYYKVG